MTAAVLDRSRSEPLYKQVAADLLDQIAAGTLAVGQKLPSEPELVARYGVSRITLRQALQLLARSGKITAHRGKGTFVSAPVVRHQLDSLEGFYDSLRKQGIEPQTRLLDFSPNAGLTDGVFATGTLLPVRLRRLYSIDSRPFAVVTGFLPESAASLGRKRADRLTVYEILEQYLGVLIDHAEVTIRCCRPPQDIANLLGVPRGGMVLLMERQSFDAAGECCEAMQIHILPERYEFRLRVTGPLELARAVRPVASRLVPGERKSK